MQTIDPKHILTLISGAYPGLVTYVDQNYCYQFVNKKYGRWFNINPDDAIGRSVVSIIGEEAFSIRKPYMEKALKGEKVRFSATIELTSKEVREVEQIYDPDFALDGSVKGFIAMAYDITEQKRAERIAQENEARFRSLAEVMPQLVWVTDSDGKLIWVNENWTRVTGLSFKETLNNGWLTALHPEDRVSTILDWQETLQTGGGTAKEYRLRMVDGSYRWHVSRAIPIRDDLGKVVRWVGTTTDIEEQKKARDVADREKKSIYSLFMQAPISLIVTTGPDHILELANHEARKYVHGREVVGRPAKDFMPGGHKNNLITIMDSIYETGVGRSFKALPISFKELNGTITRQYIDLFYEPIKDENNLTIGILSVSTNVTYQMKAMQEIRQKEKNLEEALVARDQFLSIASHELKTPLTSLKLQAQLLLRNLEKQKEFSPDRQISMAKQTNDLVGRLTRLIDDMLDVSRIRTGKLRLDKTRQDLADIVREVIFRMSVLFEAAGLNIPSIQVEGHLWGEWDRFRVEQVIGNLLTNAIRYGQGKPIEICISKKGREAVLSVRDHGYGIAREDMNRIFDRFERAINSSEVSGLGLGLFISREIIESHGGKIWVESELGQGSTFSIALPLSLA